MARRPSVVSLDRTDEGGGRVAERLLEAVAAVDAPDVVFAVSRRGRRTVVCGGTGPEPPHGRDLLRYEIGSAAKVYTGLLLARLAQQGLVSRTDTVMELLARAGPYGPGAGPAPGQGSGPGPGSGVGAVTPVHLATHTSGLPRLPYGFYPQALRRWSTQPYAGYSAERVVRAFLRARPLSAPGQRWRYSNFGVSVLGHALGAAAGTTWEDVLTREVLRPLGLDGTGLRPAEERGDAQRRDAVGYRADGRTRVPALDAGGFGPAGAVRATPPDLLAFLEAHVEPTGSPLEGALRTVGRPVLRRGGRRPEEHTLTWFRHPGAAGPFCFHAGATSGQQAFLGFQPATGTALAAVCTRRFRRGDRLVQGAYALLCEGLEPGQAEAG